MNVLKQHEGWQLITFNAASGYKIINKNKCYYEYEYKANALTKFAQITGVEL